MSVLLHFRVGRDEYRISRAINGFTAAARLEKQERGKWHSVSGSAGEIGQRVERIIGLDFDAFTKSVILPQGKFDRFLRGSRKEQRETLNDLLDMHVYQRMVQSANGRKNLAGELVIAKQAEMDPAATGEAKAECERELGVLAAEEERATDAVDRLQQALPHALILREKRNARQAVERDFEGARTPGWRLPKPPSRLRGRNSMAGAALSKVWTMRSPPWSMTSNRTCGWRNSSRKRSSATS